ncbi:hypothetical protein JCM19297_857 [Nonlabens ulvanivorans]|nr:hypothetical protein [Nonlabens ulvanivorans]GAK91360.1 hypothetical protein JCM19297_857 [Nonlabens ulvanivorans]
MGVIANDGKDDSKALINAISKLNDVDDQVILQLPAGQIILSDIIYIERSDFILRGSGSGDNGTQLYFPRPLMYVKDPAPLTELREYLIEFDKRQREEVNNIDLPFSQYAWSGGFIWTKVPGERVKSYLKKYEKPLKVQAKVYSGDRGDFMVTVDNSSNLNLGDVIELQLFNKDGTNGKIVQELYKNTNVKVGTHHFNFPELPIVRQQLEIISIVDNQVTFKSPLTISIDTTYDAQIVEWKHLENVGIEHFSIEFPMTPRVAHHVEQGFNGINLTRLYNSWVKDIVIVNADSGILTEEIANVTIKDITTKGEHYAHYTVAMAGVHNVLAENIIVENTAEHPLSFNTFSTKNVFKDCTVYKKPILDQHSGANHQNLFDNITVHINELEGDSYPLFAGGGAGYWKPSHGAYSTFWNINVVLKSPDLLNRPLLLNGMLDGPHARVIGIHGNSSFLVRYEPLAYIKMTNQSLHDVPSLYDYQLNSRSNK